MFGLADEILEFRHPPFKVFPDMARGGFQPAGGFGNAEFKLFNAAVEALPVNSASDASNPEVKVDK